MEKLYFLEFSRSQGHFHIDEASTLCSKNLEMTLRGGEPEYFPIFVGSLADCDRLADMLRSKLLGGKDAKRKSL